MKDISFIFTREPDSMSGVEIDYPYAAIKVNMTEESKLHPSILEVFGNIDYTKFIEDTNLNGYTQKIISPSLLTAKNLYVKNPFAIRVNRVNVIYRNGVPRHIAKEYYFPRIKYRNCSFDVQKYENNNLCEYVGCEWREK